MSVFTWWASVDFCPSMRFSSQQLWLSLIWQRHCEKRANNNENFTWGHTDQRFCLKTERKRWKRERERRQSTHLEHHPVLFLRLLNHTHVAPHCDFWHVAGRCRSTTAPDDHFSNQDSLYQGLLFVVVGEPHPHSQGCGILDYSSSE